MREIEKIVDISLDEPTNIVTPSDDNDYPDMSLFDNPPPPPPKYKLAKEKKDILKELNNNIKSIVYEKDYNATKIDLFN